MDPMYIGFTRVVDIAQRVTGRLGTSKGRGLVQRRGLPGEWTTVWAVLRRVH